MQQDKGSWEPDCRKNCLHYKSQTDRDGLVFLCNHPSKILTRVWYPSHEIWHCSLYENNDIHATTDNPTQLFRQGAMQLNKGQQDICDALIAVNYENLKSEEAKEIFIAFENFIINTKDAFRRLEEAYGELK